jgi:hypothetical protein
MSAIDQLLKVLAGPARFFGSCPIADVQSDGSAGWQLPLIVYSKR